MNRRAVFIAGCRTPFARSNTELADLSAYDLARMAIKGLLVRYGISAGDVDHVLLGSVVQNVRTTNVAREAALAAGIPATVPAHTITMACISSNRAGASAAEMIASGQAEVVLIGGTESLSDVPIVLKKPLRRRLAAARRVKSPSGYLSLLRGLRPADLAPEAPSIAEYSTGKTMGESGEELAALFGISRQAQDQYAMESHHRAASAWESGHLADEVVPVMLAGHAAPFVRDNGIRADTSMEKLARLEPAFVKPYGNLTAGNSTYLTDGASAALVASETYAREHDLDALAYLGPHVFVAQEPNEELLLGPATAIPNVLDAAGLQLEDVDVFEVHEAFAGQMLAVLAALESERFARERLGRQRPVGVIPRAKLNAWGGSLSVGHPFGATGVRLITTAVHRLYAEDGRFALVAACAAGGLGTAMILERHPNGVGRHAFPTLALSNRT